MLPQNIQDDSTEILEEIFNDLHENIYCDYERKIEQIIRISNTDYFLSIANRKIESLYEDFKSFQIEIPNLLEDLKKKTMESIKCSVYEGICTMKEKLDSILNKNSIQKLKSINIYDILESFASDNFKELFDPNIDERRKADILYSYFFEEKKLNAKVYENNQNKTSDFYEKYNEQKDVAAKQMLENIVKKLIEKFKPLEKKLILAADVQKKTSYATGGLLSAAGAATVVSVIFPPAAIVAIPLYSASAVAAVPAVGLHVKLGKRKNPGWYANVEKKFTNYLKSSNNESDKKEIKRLIDDEALESDKNHFIDQLESFFDDFILFDLLLQRVDLTSPFRLKKIHPDGFKLMFESSWTIIRALMFKKKMDIDRLNEIEKKLQELSEKPDLKTYMPLFWFKLDTQSHNLGDQDNERVIVELLGPFYDYESKKIKNLLPEAQVNISTKTIEIKRSSLHTLINILSTISDFKFRGLLIRDCNIAIGNQVLFPSFNRMYGKSLLPEENGFDLSSFKETNFDWLSRGKYCYYCPNGWLRYSLKVEKSSQKFDEKYQNWPVAYHGTSSLVLMNILKTGFKLSVNAGCAAHGEGVYFSPSIEYSAHNRYAKVMTIKNRRNEEFYMQAIFQCRLNPNSFVEKTETLLKKTEKSFRIDPNYSNDKIEWVIKNDSFKRLRDRGEDPLVIYGIMVRLTKEHPRSLNQSAWWEKCHFVI